MSAGPDFEWPLGGANLETRQEELVTTKEAPRVPHHVEDAVATIATLHAAHHREARALQKAISRATSGIAQPGTLILITLAIAIWVTFNLALPEFGRAALDPFPFPLLATIVSTSMRTNMDSGDDGSRVLGAQPKAEVASGESGSGDTHSSNERSKCHLRPNRP